MKLQKKTLRLETLVPYNNHNNLGKLGNKDRLSSTKKRRKLTPQNDLSDEEGLSLQRKHDIPHARAKFA